MLISASLSQGRRSAGPASALTSGDRDKLHERQREGGTRDCPPNGHGAPAEETLEEGYRCGSASSEKIISDPGRFGRDPSPLASNARHWYFWPGPVMLERPGFDITDEKQDRQHWGRTESAR